MSISNWKKYRKEIGMGLAVIGASILAVLAFNAGHPTLPALGVILVIGGGVLINRYGDQK